MTSREAVERVEELEVTVTFSLLEAEAAALFLDFAIRADDGMTPSTVFAALENLQAEIPKCESCGEKPIVGPTGPDSLYFCDECWSDLKEGQES